MTSHCQRTTDVVVGLFSSGFQEKTSGTDLSHYIQTGCSVMFHDSDEIHWEKGACGRYKEEAIQ